MKSNSVTRKFAMALSALLLIGFLVLHVVTNLLSITPVFGNNAYNVAANFLGYDSIVQFILQPILMVGLVYHFVMGMILEYQNHKARPIKYGYRKNSNIDWATRNMIISGIVVLAFLGLHLYDFWAYEMDYKFIEHLPKDPTRYLGEVHAKFADLWRVIIYIIGFIALGLHLSHGFWSAFQSVGTTGIKYMRAIRALGKIYCIAVPAGFILVALFHYLTR